LAEPQCPDICSNIIPDDSVRVFLGNMGIPVSGLLLKQIALHNVSFIQSVEGLTRTKD
jgi:hypothetical protein